MKAKVLIEALGRGKVLATHHPGRERQWGIKEPSVSVKCTTQSGWLSLMVVSGHPKAQLTMITTAMMMTLCEEDTNPPFVY